MKIINQSELHFEFTCKRCKSTLLIEPRDWRYIPPQKDISGCYDNACIVTNCISCDKQIVFEERDNERLFCMIKQLKTHREEI